MPIEKVTIGPHVLYCGDCRDILPTLGKVDAVVTDPPYLVAAKGGGIAAKRQYLSDIHQHIDSGFDVSVLDGFKNWLVFCGKPQIISIATHAESMGLRWQLLTWNKTNPTPLSNNNYLPDTEYMIHGFQSHHYESKTRFVVGQVERPEFDHPTVKPQYVMHKAVMSASRRGDTVLDMYMGTASTGVACANLGRTFIGIERERKYFDIACRRIEDAVNAGVLFTGRIERKAEPVLFDGSK